MPVNYTPPTADSLFPVPGVRIGVARAGIRKPDRLDLLVIALDEGTHAAGVFTRNRFCAAPVILAREHLSGAAPPRLLVINTGNANAGTGEQGMARARETCSAAAALFGCVPASVLPFSTGVIMEPLPVDRLKAGLPECFKSLEGDRWLEAATAIMTTDTVPKAASRRVLVGAVNVTVTGIAKGAGMIQPNMATMLGFIATDAAIAPELLRSMAGSLAGTSFNCITVDGDTSTNDSFIVIATGRAPLDSISSSASPYYAPLLSAMSEVAQSLAQAIVRDGEGATKFITVRVEQGRTAAESDRVARSIAHSPLVKTAFFASDPNLGRILAAVGNAGIDDLDVSRINLYLGDVLVAKQGGRAKSYVEANAQRVMKEPEITVRVELGRGDASATIWTCDLSHDYVTINAEYRS